MKSDVICGNCGHKFKANSLQIRRCPHPAVQAKKGRYICVWCCSKCSFLKPINKPLGATMYACRY